MTRAEIASLIAGIGLPYAYDHFTADDSPGGPPFICFMYTDDADFKADDTNYQRITDLTLELYVDEPDFTKEAAIEAALAEAGLVYARSGPDYIQNERMYQTTYETSVLLTDNPPAPEEPDEPGDADEPQDADPQTDDETATPTEEPLINDTEVLEQDAEREQG